MSPSFKSSDSQYSSVRGVAIPGFELEAKLGEGGMGAVYRATQLSLDRPVAIKLLPRKFSRDAQMVERFDREAGTLARLSHPNLVPIFEKGKAAGRSFFVMELIDGPTLRALVASEALTRSEFKQLTEQVGSALDYIHQNSIVHRDLKPSNILRDDRGNFRVSDFGLISLITTGDDDKISRRSSSHGVSGTIMYLAPEQLHGNDPISDRTDIYGFAVVLFEMITGIVPLGRFKAPREINNTVSEELNDALMRALSRQPSDRFEKVSDFTKAVLDGIEASANLRLRPSEVARESSSRTGHSGHDPDTSGSAFETGEFSALSDRKKQRARRRLIAYGSLGVILALVAAIVVIFYPKTSDDSGDISRSFTANLMTEIDWADSWQDALARAYQEDLIPLLLVSQTGELPDFEMNMHKNTADTVKGLVVPVHLSRAEAQGINGEVNPSSMPRLYTFNQDGSEIMLQGPYPPAEGLLPFLRSSKQLSDNLKRWSGDLISSLKPGVVGSGRPILILADDGKKPNVIDYYRYEVLENERIANNLLKIGLLAFSDPIQADYMTESYGIFQFPVILVLAPDPINRAPDGSPEWDVVDRVYNLPLTDFDGIAGSIERAVR